MPKLLLVEDNEMNRHMLLRRLTRLGYECVTAADGVQALAAARRERPDAILMDLSLPVMDGWDAARALRADGATAGIPIIALTAHAMADDRQRALKAGCDDFATKPIDFPVLATKIAELIACGREHDV
jgi:CheY-like chemotaxis protein